MTGKIDQPDTGSGKRPKNREVEDEMIRQPAEKGQPPRPATEPKKTTATH